MTPSVEIRNLIKEFPEPNGSGMVRAVNDISLEIADGEFFALLGPSGCGKTTTLRAIAGFEAPSSGEILIRGETMQGVPAFHRPVNTVFQDYALFPHMTILQNVMFGLKMEGFSRRDSKKRAMEALELVQLPHVADRRPRQLSGGQQQRIALARALVKKPAVLLLDEPLGALDLKLRKAMQFELKTMQQQVGITFIYVTHDQEEAMTMADRIAIMNHGDVLQVGPPEEVYERPADRFVADFIGETNFLEGGLMAKDGDLGKVQFADGTVINAHLWDHTVDVSQHVTVVLRPEKISLFPIEGSFKNRDGYREDAVRYKARLEQDPNTTLLTGHISETYYIGTDTRYTVQLADDQTLVARVQNFSHRFDTTFKAGQAVVVFWDIENASILL